MQFAISSSFLANISGKVNGYWRQFVYGHVVVVIVDVDVAMTCRQHLRPLEIASRCQMRRQTATTTTTQHKEAATRKRSNTFRFPLSVCNFGLLFLCWLCTLHSHTHQHTPAHTHSKKKATKKTTTTTREKKLTSTQTQTKRNSLDL